MPCGPRLDAPGVPHHVMARGIERQRPVLRVTLFCLRGGFNVLAKLIGLPGKMEINGSMVQQLWEEGRLSDIHRYCRQDVRQTYFLFLRVELLRGRLTTEQYDRALTQSAGFRAELEA